MCPDIANIFPFRYIDFFWDQASAIMGDLIILVWNAGGLNAPHTWTSVLSLLRCKKIDLALVQETHLIGQDSKRLANKFYHVKTGGVAVIARHYLPIKVLDVWADVAGRIAIVKAELYGQKIAPASIYGPNKFDKEFYDNLTQQML